MPEMSRGPAFAAVWLALAVCNDAAITPTVCPAGSYCPPGTRVATQVGRAGAAAAAALGEGGGCTGGVVGRAAARRVLCWRVSEAALCGMVWMHWRFMATRWRARHPRAGASSVHTGNAPRVRVVGAVSVPAGALR